MGLICGQNSAVNSLRDSAVALTSLLSGGAAALGSASGALGGIKSKIAGLKPALPKFVDSFAEGLLGLAGAGDSAVAAFRAKWSGRVADLDGWIAKSARGAIANFCRDVPAINIDNTGKTVSAARASTLASDTPTPASIPSTAATNALSLASSGRSGLVPSEVAARTASLSRDFQKTVAGPMASRLSDARKAMDSAVSSPIYAGVEKAARDSGRSIQTLVSTGALDPTQLSSVKAVSAARDRVAETQSYAADLNRYWTALSSGTSSSGFREWEAGLVSSDSIGLIQKAGALASGNRAALDAEAALLSNSAL